MKLEYEQALFRDFPLLYDRSRSIRDSCMGFGFECGDGWYGLIRELSEKLYPFVEAFSRDATYNPYVTQVKEKYGGLRFYMSVATEEMNTVIEEYCTKSFSICEFCGDGGEARQKGPWFFTRCNQCFGDNESYGHL